MAPTARNTKIRKVFNLLKPSQPPPTGWDRIYDWLVGRARVVMIVAEIIVAVTFITKVVVDTQAKALEDEIARKDTELKQFEISTEPTLRSLQNRARSYKKLWNTATKYSDYLAEIDGYILNPGSDLLLTFNNSSILISGEESFQNLSQIEASMKGSTSFVNPTITSLDADTGGNGSGEYQLNAEIIKLNNRNQLQ